MPCGLFESDRRTNFCGQHHQGADEERRMAGAVIIAYDDSDGWCDHQMSLIVMQSSVTDDQLLGPGNCGSPKASDVAGGTRNGRCGYGPRFVLELISPYAKTNYVDHAITDLSSILGLLRITGNWAGLAMARQTRLPLRWTGGLILAARDVATSGTTITCQRRKTDSGPCDRPNREIRLHIL
jgi:hypothetical protein